MKLGPYHLEVSGVSRSVLVDRRFSAKLVLYSWKWDSKLKRARAVVRKKEPRQLLHRYIVRFLAGKDWEEIFFLNEDIFDCRMQNLKPYRREVEGANRRRFKNNRSGFKGVTYVKSKDKWQSVIRVRRKLRHLGYFPTAELAAKEYAKEFRKAHPNAQQFI